MVDQGALGLQDREMKTLAIKRIAILLYWVGLLAWLQSCGREDSSVNFPPVLPVSGFRPIQISGFETSSANDDTDYGGGIATNTYGTAGTTFKASVIATDGKIVSAFDIVLGTSRDFGVVRFRSDGSYDTAFNTRGWSYANIVVSDTTGAIGLQPDGKILVGGRATTLTGLARLTIDGRIDTSFSTDGVLTTTTSSYLFLKGNVDQTIYAVGPQATRQHAVRYLSDGSLDTAYSTDGIAIWSLSTSDGLINANVDSAGRVLATGQVVMSGTTDILLSRLLTDGSMDTSFATTGMTYYNPLNLTERGYDVEALTDGKIAVSTIANNALSMVRLLSDSTIDTSFSTDGLAGFYSTQSFGYSMDVQTDGKFVVGGSINTNLLDFALARFNVSGEFDTSFNTNGRNTVSIGALADSAYTMHVLTSGSVLAMGTSASNYVGGVQLLIDGSLDTSFATSGKLTASAIASGAANYASVVEEASQKISAVGDTYIIGIQKFLIARHTRSGTLDTSFSTDGSDLDLYTNTITAFYDFAQATNGKYLAVGSQGGTPDFIVARYLTDGSLDTSFKTNGLNITDFGGSDIATCTVIQTDGLTVVGGYKSSNWLAARYLSDGTLDTSFATSGRATLNLSGNALDQLNDIQLDSNNRLVLGGRNNASFAMARLQSNGSFDTSFSTIGYVTHTTVGTSGAYTIISHPDGKTLLGGIDLLLQNARRSCMLRLLSDGNLDTSFMTLGRMTATLVGGRSQAFSFTTQRNNKIYATGNFLPSGATNNQFLIVRYNSNGSFDTTFGTKGFLTQAISSNGDQANSIIVLTDGRVLAAGHTISGPQQSFLFKILP